MQSLLICGGNKNERINRALDLSQGINKEDLIVQEAKTTIGIGQVRELQRLLSLKPYSSPFKVCLIHDAQLLTFPAQNALLKTLEEPPQKTLIILIAPTPESLLPTIISRCQIIRLPKKSEIELNEEEINEQLETSILELTSSQADRLKLAQKIARNRDKTLDFLSRQMVSWRKILLEKLWETQRYLQIQALSNLTTLQVTQILRKLDKIKRMVEGNINCRLCLENFFLSLPILKKPHE